MSNRILDVENIKKYFSIKAGLLPTDKNIVKAVDGVSLIINRNETVGLVGESGCGKSTLGKTIIRLLEPNSGSISLNGINITKLKGKELKSHRKKMQIIFQDPISSLNPRMKIIDIINEPLKIHTNLNREERKTESLRLLSLVGIPESSSNRFPHQFSGGQCQRIAIARALSLKPDLIIADEAVSALDVSIQAQILNLMADLQEKLGLSYLFISHDLAVVSHISHRVIVMYLGEVVEEGETSDIVENPKHPYTKALVSAIPSVNSNRKTTILKGAIPSSINRPTGCSFHTRCPVVQDRCINEKPELIKSNNRSIRCHFVQPI